MKNALFNNIKLLNQSLILTDVDSVILDNINSKNISCENEGCLINSMNSEIFNLTNSYFDDFYSS